jgi:glycerol-3-phosphate acyltransferase PlsY
VPVPLLALSLGYAVGSIPFAFIAGRLAAGVDLRRAGSGNPGAANALRIGGVSLAVSVLLLDVMKGAVSVLWASRLGPGDAAPALAGLAAVVGHIYPISMRFKGGKGVATAAGVFGVLSPASLVPAAVLFVATVWATRYISLGSIVATLALGPIAWSLGASSAVVAAASAIAALVIFRHRSNIGRLRRGAERRIGQRVVS